MSKNIGKIIRVNSLPPKGERLTNVIYQVAVQETATYIDYAVDENGDIKTPTLDKSLAENDFSKVKTVNNEVPDEQGNIDVNDYVQIYNSEEELQEIWDNGMRDKIYFNHQTKDMVIGDSDGDGYSLFKMDEYLDKPIITATDQEYPYVVVIDNEGKSAKRDLEYFGKVKTVNNQEPDEAGDIKVNSPIETIRDVKGLYSKNIGALENLDSTLKTDLALQSSIFLGKNSGANLTNTTSVTTDIGMNIIALGENTLADTDIRYTSYLTAIGTNAYQYGNGGYQTIAIGYDVAKNINVAKADGNNYNILLGAKNAIDAGKLSSVISLGYGASGKLQEGYNSLIMGMNAAQEADYVSNDILLGNNAGKYLKKNVNSGYGNSIGIGLEAYGGSRFVDGQYNKTQSQSIYIGYRAGGLAGIGQRNIGIGSGAGRAITGMGNVAIGSYFERDVDLGAGREVIGDNNIILGGRAGVETKGSNNFMVGYHIGSSTNGNGNVNILGSRSISANNTILINTFRGSGYNPTSNTINIGSTIIGNSVTRKIGIGMPATDTNQVEPREVLDVNGYIASDGIKIDSGNFQSTLDTLQLTNNVTHKLPNKSGTIALLEDLNMTITSPDGSVFKLAISDLGELTTIKLN